MLVEEIEAEIAGSDINLELLGNIEEFPAEGTRELYVGSDKSGGRLLLIQAVADGPYQSAYERRGAGLHHIAIDVPDVDEFLIRQPESGWNLHPVSSATLRKQRIVWLCRTGHPLIEVQEQAAEPPAEKFIERIEFPVSERRLIDALDCRNITGGDCCRLIEVGGRQINLPCLR